MNIKSKADGIRTFLNAMKVLRDENILINKKDFTGQIGEWLVEQIYDGKRSTNGIQKGWDVEIGDKKIQVKTHSKADTNRAKFTVINKETCEGIDEVIIIVFSQDYKLKEFYRLPWSIASSFTKLRGRKKPKDELSWRLLNEFRINIKDLPNQEIVSLFE